MNDRPQPIRVVGVRVDPWEPDALRRMLAGRIAGENSLTTVVAVNPDAVVLANRDEPFAAALERADVCVADGIGVVAAARLSGFGARRVSMLDLMVDAAAACAATRLKVVLYGTEPGVAPVAADRFRALLPQLRVDAFDREDPDVEARIAALGPALVCVGLGRPDQERWTDDRRELLQDSGVRVAMSVSAAIEHLAETRPRAPIWTRRAGLEWAWRLVRESRDRSPRAATALPSFIRNAFADAVRHRRR